MRQVSILLQDENPVSGSIIIWYRPELATSVPFEDNVLSSRAILTECQKLRVTGTTQADTKLFVLICFKNTGYTLRGDGIVLGACGIQSISFFSLVNVLRSE